MVGSSRVSTLLLTAVLSLLTLLAACEAKRSPSSDPATKTSRSTTGEVPVPPRVLGTVPRFALTNEAQKTATNVAMAGSPWIVTFIFTRCGATCPAQTAQFKKLQDEIQTDPGMADVRLMSITVDPANDTAAVLKEYGRKAGAVPQRWTFLTGNRDAIWTLCKDGFKLPVADSKDNPNMPISHSQSFVLIDRVGRIRGYYDGLNEKARQKLKKDIGYVLNDPNWPVCVHKLATNNTEPGPALYRPPEVKDTPWLADPAAAQLATRLQFDVYHDFKFTDRLPESGITFRNRVVDDAGKDLKPVTTIMEPEWPSPMSTGTDASISTSSRS
jgi:protein SCO1/2